MQHEEGVPPEGEQDIVAGLRRALSEAQRLCYGADAQVQAWEAAGRPPGPGGEVLVHRAMLGACVAHVTPDRSAEAILALLEAMDVGLPVLGTGDDRRALVVNMVEHFASIGLPLPAGLDAVRTALLPEPGVEVDDEQVRAAIASWAPALPAERVEELAAWLGEAVNEWALDEHQRRGPPEPPPTPEEVELNACYNAGVVPADDVEWEFRAHLKSVYRVFCAHVGWLAMALRMPATVPPSADDPVGQAVDQIQRAVFEARAVAGPARGARALLAALAELPRPLADELVEALAGATHEPVVARRLVRELDRIASILVILCRAWAAPPPEERLVLQGPLARQRLYGLRGTITPELGEALAAVPPGAGLCPAVARAFGPTGRWLFCDAALDADGMPGVDGSRADADADGHKEA